MRTIEDLYADLEAARKLGLSESEDRKEVIDALNSDYENAELGINELGEVWGNSIDIVEFEDTQLTIRTRATMGFMGS